jgi:Zn-dependent protease/predicted transcriptional regulator
MQGSLKLGSIARIDIRLHYTWLFAFFLIAVSLALGYFPGSNSEFGVATPWILGIVAAMLLFGSVLVHELAHSLVAGARGLRVNSITLFIFGGVSSITREPASSKDEFLIAVVGPLTSFVLAAFFWLLGQAAPSGSSIAAISGYLGFANLLLGLFNIVPGFPLDGGRVLRSIIWAYTRNMSGATRIASYIGQTTAFVLIGWGIVNVLSGNFVGGLWTALIGWFLNSSAEGARQQDSVQNLLDGVPVSSIMDVSPEAASPELLVREFMLEHALRQGQRALPVLDNGHLLGIVSVTDAKHLGQDAWATTPVSDIMSRTPLKTVGPDTDLSTALRLLVENDVHQLPVLQNGRLMGMLSRADIMRYIQLGLDLRSPGSSAAEALAAARA